MSTNNNNNNYTSNDDKLINILSCLQAYSKTHVNGNKELKCSIWNIFKSRRDIGGLHLVNDAASGTSAFSAYSVREELRASVLLEMNDNDSKNDDDMADSFTLHLNGIKQVKDDDDKENISDTNNLRQRKKDDKTGVSKVWTTEKYEDGDDQENYLRTIDPIVLFNGGMSPPSLKEAQKNACASLEYYIEAANLIVAILKLMESK